MPSQPVRRNDNDTAVWRPAGQPRVIEYSRMVLEELRVAGEEGFQKIPHGGIEVGALLLGTHEGDTVRILEWRPMECEHARGPGFVLSDKDRIALETLMAQCAVAPELRGMEPVGWFHTHTRSKIFLSPEDLEVHQHFFPESWQVALVMRLVKDGPPTAGFFVREEDGSVRLEASHQDFTILPDPAALAGPARISALRKGATPRRDVRMIRPAAPNAIDAPAQPAPRVLHSPPAVSVLDDPPPAQTAPAPLAPAKSSPWLWVSVVLALLLAAAGGVIGSKLWNTGSAPDNVVRIEESGSLLLVTWDHAARSVASADRGLLHIRDGPGQRQIELPTYDVRRGSLSYARITGDVDVRLELFQAGQRTAEHRARFAGAPAPLKAPESKAAPAPKPSLDPELQRLREALTAEEDRGRELRNTIRDSERQLKREPARK